MPDQPRYRAKCPSLFELEALLALVESDSTATDDEPVQVFGRRRSDVQTLADWRDGIDRLRIGEKPWPPL